MVAPHRLLQRAPVVVLCRSHSPSNAGHLPAQRSGRKPDYAAALLASGVEFPREPDLPARPDRRHSDQGELELADRVRAHRLVARVGRVSVAEPWLLRRRVRRVGRRCGYPLLRLAPTARARSRTAGAARRGRDRGDQPLALRWRRAVQGQVSDAGAEFRIAIAGPPVSLVLGVLFVLVAAFAGLPNAIDGVVAWLGYTNLILLAFNLLPAFPLDGGRVCVRRSGTSGATCGGRRRVAAGVGRGFGYLFIGLGIFMLIVEGAFSGAWLAFIGCSCSRQRPPKPATSRPSKRSTVSACAT